MEDVPVIGEFIVSSAERDIKDFNGYSAMFTIDYFATVRSKIEVCRELIKSTTVSKELKDVTHQLHEKSRTLRIKLNALEGYLKLGAEKLDIAVEDVGLKNIRKDISRGNIEVLLSNIRASLVIMKRNLPALKAQGLKQPLIADMEAYLQEINALNEKRNALISKRNRLSVENTGKFNDLWNMLRLIMNTAKAIYRDVDEVKLEDYTVAKLKHRISVER
jgi:hypothetical protein